MTRWQAFACVVLIWAAIYLPALGTLEIKGEEGRRLLPAVSMLETGNWIVPSIGGVNYLSKPPLVNWLAAGAFKLVGDPRNEWAARLPSVLAVLMMALCIVGSLSTWLGADGALLAAIFALTNIGLMEKGRLAEIEAVYLSLTGIAVVLWLGAWRNEMVNAGPLWRTWTLPWIFLGLGLLAKGPLHLIFFYAVVVAVLVCAKRWRELFNWWHLAGLILMLAIFAAWAVPYLRATSAERAGGVWLAQFQGRLEVEEGFRFGSWILNIPRGLANYVPWTLLLPLAFVPWPPVEIRPDADDLDRALARGLRWAVAGCFLAVSLAPGGQPRYTLPLLAPVSVLLALSVIRRVGRFPEWLAWVWARTVAAAIIIAVVAAPVGAALSGKGWRPWAAAAGVVVAGVCLLRVVWRWRAPERLVALALASATAMALLTFDYAFGAVKHLRKGESVRPEATAINHVLAGGAEPTFGQAAGLGERTAILRPGFLPMLFYFRRAPFYVQSTDTPLPASIHYLMLRADDAKAAAAALRARGITPRIVARAHDKRAHESTRAEWLLWRL